MLLRTTQPSRCLPLLLPKPLFLFCSLPEVENHRAAVRETSLWLPAGPGAPCAVKDSVLTLTLVLLCLKKSFLLHLKFGGILLDS